MRSSMLVARRLLVCTVHAQHGSGCSHSRTTVSATQDAVFENERRGRRWRSAETWFSTERRYCQLRSGDTENGDGHREGGTDAQTHYGF